MAGMIAANMAQTGKANSDLPVGEINQLLALAFVTWIPSGMFSFSVMESPASQSTKSMAAIAMGTPKSPKARRNLLSKNWLFRMILRA